MAELLIVVQAVVGSSPIKRPHFVKKQDCIILLFLYLKASMNINFLNHYFILTFRLCQSRGCENKNATASLCCGIFIRKLDHYLCSFC